MGSVCLAVAHDRRRRGPFICRETPRVLLGWVALHLGGHLGSRHLTGSNDIPEDAHELVDPDTLQPSQPVTTHQQVCVSAWCKRGRDWRHGAMPLPCPIFVGLRLFSSPVWGPASAQVDAVQGEGEASEE